MTTQTQQKVYSYDDLIQDICKDPAGIHNLGHGTTQGYLRKDGKFIRRDRQTGKNKVYDFGKDFANSYGKLQGFDKNGMAPISINSQGLVPLEYKDQDGKTAITFMAGPKGAKINGHGIGRGKTTGWYKVDDTAKKDLYSQFNFHGKGHKGITTYVDRDSELESNHSIPEYSSLIDSNVKIDTKDPESYFNKLNLEDSDLNIKGASAINVKGMIPKVTGILMPGDKIDDKIAVNKNLPVLNPKSHGMKEITKYEQNPDYDPDFEGGKFSKTDYGQSLLHNVEHAFRDENLLSKEAKNNILEWNHPEMAKQTDPTDDL